MTESLLSFSNIDLFGQAIAELAIVDPDRPTAVKAATVANVGNLQGLQNIDGVVLAAKDRVLVWKQNNANIHENGIYVVRDDPANTWEMILQDIPPGSYVKSSDKGVTQGKKQWRLKRADKVRPADVTFTIAITAGGQPTSVSQLTVSRPKLHDETLLTTPIKLDPALDLYVLAAQIADAVNDDKKTGYTASSSGATVTIHAPVADGESANDGKLTVTETNLDVTPANLPFGNWGISTIRTFEEVSNREAAKRRRGENRQLERQLTKDARFARIYGFSYEGNYYDLPRPVLFLVHGEGDLVTEEELEGGSPHPARAPGTTSLTGLAAAGFDFADGLRVWSYDQADYTIRMDVETGMFEQVLLDAMLDGGGPGGMDSSGMNARGMNARGMNARGMNARGMNARGMNARGMNARGGSD